MRSSLPVRIAAAIALCAEVAGCGQSSSPTVQDAGPREAVPAGVQAPRALELSANLRPMPATPNDAPRAESIGYTELSPAAAGPPPRIREISATPDSTDRGLIREPGALPAEVHEPAPLAQTAERPRNSYVPLVMPQIGQPPASVPPHLASTPTFGRFHESPSAPAIAAMPPVPVSKVESYRVAAVSRPADSPAPVSVPTETLDRLEPVHPAVPEIAAQGTSARAPNANSPQLQAVTAQVQQISAQAQVMAERGMLFSARSDLLKGLQWIAQGLDAEQGGAIHASALAAGLTALDEAGEFCALQTQPVNASSASSVANRHRTPLLCGEHRVPISAVAAQQQYLAYAQSQLAIAAGGLPVASQVHYQLGRLHTGLSTIQSDADAMLVPRAMVFHQAALATDPSNHLAANELGVLLARCGQLTEARSLLLRSVSIRPHAEAWHNLAVVHSRLGEADLAKRAQHERDLVSRQAAGNRTVGDVVAGNRVVRWVDGKTFADNAGQSPGPEKAEQGIARAASSPRR